MSLEQGLLQEIAASSDVTAIVPNDVSGNPQIYWGLAPKGAKPPYLILERVATGDTYTVTGPSGLRAGLFGVHCFVDSKAGVSSGFYVCRDLANAVRQLLQAYTGTLPDSDSTKVSAVFIEKDWNMPYQEGATGFVFHNYLEFRIWYRES